MQGELIIPKNLEPINKKLYICLENIEFAAKDFWYIHTISHYTEHNINHSQRIIEIIGKLLENDAERLNDYERFILIAAALLHDIGMQSPIHAGLEKKLNILSMN